MARKRFTVDAVFRGINKISKPAKSMGRSISKFVKKSNRQIAKLGRNFKKLGSFMGKAVIGGAVLAAAAMGAAVIKTAELGDEAAKTARKLGISAEALQELRFAADRQGVTNSVLNASFTALSKRVGELKVGTGALFGFLNKTGDKAFARQLVLAKNTEEAFALITEKANTIKDPLKKAAFASAAFSRAGIDMINFMNAGADGIVKLREEARKYGAVISNEAAAKSELFVDATTNLKASLGGVSKAIGSKLIPIITPLIDRFNDFWALNKGIIGAGMDRFISGMGKAFNFLKPIVITLFKVFKGLFGAFKTAVSSLLPNFTAETKDMKKGVTGLADGLKFMAGIATKAFEFITFISPFLKPFIATLLIFKGVMIAIALVTKGWAIAQGILNTVMALNPISLIVIAIAVLVAGIILLVKNWDTVVTVLKKVWDSFLSFIEPLTTKIKPITDAISGLARAVIDLLIRSFEQLWEKAKTIFDNISEKLKPFLQIFKDISSVIGGTLVGAFNSLWETARPILEKIQNFLKPITEGIGGVFKTLGKFFGGGGDLIKDIAGKITSVTKVISETGREKEAARPVTPQERLSRSIEENTSRQITETENNSTLTIQDKTGKAELSPQKRGGPKIALATSGGL